MRNVPVLALLLTLALLGVACGQSAVAPQPAPTVPEPPVATPAPEPVSATPQTPVAATAPETTAPAAETVSAETVGAELVDALAKGDLDTACVRFSKALRQSMPSSRVKDRWDRVVTHFGAFRERESVRVESLTGEQSVLVTCAFEKGEVCFQVTVNDGGEVTGFFVRPAHEAVPQTEETTEPVDQK